MSTVRSLAGRISAGWAVLGVSALFASAAYRLGERGIATILDGMAMFEWVALLVLTFVFVYGEGHRALQLRWVPALMARAERLAHAERSLVFRVLAPLYGLSLIGGSSQQLKRAWLGAGAILVAIAGVRALPDPWRGIIDFSVAAALVWGLATILLAAPRVLR